MGPGLLPARVRPHASPFLEKLAPFRGSPPDAVPPTSSRQIAIPPSTFSFDGALSVAFDLNSHEGEHFGSVTVEEQSRLEIVAGRALSTAVADAFNRALAPAEMISIGGRMPGSSHPNALYFSVAGTATFTILLGAPSVVCPNFQLGRGSGGRGDNYWLGMPGCAPATLADAVGLRCACGEQTIVFAPSGDSARSVAVSVEQ